MTYHNSKYKCMFTNRLLMYLYMTMRIITSRREFEDMIDTQGNTIICCFGTLSMLSSRGPGFSPLF